MSAAVGQSLKPGTAPLDWANLGFEFRPTKSHMKFVWKNGKWDEVGFSSCKYLCASAQTPPWKSVKD